MQVMFGELESYPKETKVPQEQLINGFIDTYYSGRKRGSTTYRKRRSTTYRKRGSTTYRKRGNTTLNKIGSTT